MRSFRGSRDGSSMLVLLTAVLVFVVAFLCVSHSRPVRNLISVKVVRIDMRNGFEIRPVIAQGRQSDGESFSHMIGRTHPYAAINGTYYDENMRPLGDLLSGGRLINRGGYRNALGITNSGEVEFIHRRRGRIRWHGYRAGIAAGPRLVHHGKVDLDPVADGFSRNSLSVRAWRSGVGITKSGTVLLVTAKESITLSEFARVMLDLGAVEAMNLDGGGACGLYCKGRMLTTPALPMTNILAIYKKS